jgi:hypothetical protein
MSDWLERLLGQMLLGEVDSGLVGLKIRIVDAAVITGPGSIGTDWRAHVLMDLVSGKYCTARGIDSIVNNDADVLVRVNPHSLKVCDLEKNRIDLFSYEQKISKKETRSWDVLIPVPPETYSKHHKKWELTEAKAWISARLVATRTRKNTMLWLLTTLNREQLSDKVAVRLYRWRWQIELLFKRLKSLLGLDKLPTRNGPTAKTWLLSRFLAAALAQRMVIPSGFSPR